MAKKGTRSKAITYKGFLHLSNALLDHPDFIALSGDALKLLVCIGRQYNGYNNGDLQASLKCLKPYGWNSNRALTQARRELLERGWITKTRTGGLGMGPDLFAITWQPIDECSGKLEVKATLTAPRSLRDKSTTHKKTQVPNPIRVQ
jgi:hypothetical protein